MPEKMGVHNFHIFDSAGNCLYSMHPPVKPDQQQILYGFLYSLKSFTGRMTPVLARDNTFFLYTTSSYRLVFYEFPTSMKFVLILSADMRHDSDYYRDLLRTIYRDIYVQYVVKNPAIAPPLRHETIASSSANHITRSTIDCDLFRSQLNQFLSQNNLL